MIVNLSILHVIMGYPPRIGGAENQAELIAENQSKNGHKVTVFTRFENGFKRKETIRNVSIQRFFYTNFKGSKEITAIIIGFKLLFNHKKYDVIQVHQGHFLSSVISFVCKLIKKPCFIKIANSGEKFDLNILQNTRFIGKIALKILLKSKPYFVSITKQISTELKRYQVSEQYIFEIPNGVAISKKKFDVKKRFNSRNVCFFGRLEGIKRPDMIIKLSEYFDESYEFHIYGDGSLKEKLTQLCNTKKITNAFVHGGINNINEILLDSSLVILPSLTEGMSNSLLEAISFGVPIVATDIPQNKFITNNDLNLPAGELINPDDVMQWVLSIRNLLEDFDKYYEFSKNSISLSKIYDIKKTSKMYLDAYSEILEDLQLNY